MKKHLGVNHPEYQKQQALIDEIQPQIEATRASIAQRVEANITKPPTAKPCWSRTVKETKTEFDDLNSRSFELPVAEARGR